MSQKKVAPPRAGFGCLRWMLLALLACLVLPIAEVGCVRFANPPVTPLMLLRPLEARLQGRPTVPRHYRWIALPQMPRSFLRCAITSEDQRFFTHHGFDWREVAIAQREAERRGTAPRGASTISMQCARSLFLWQGRSWVRKGIEAYFTFWMETLLTKRRILELYANVIEMGDGIYGVEAAAQEHFGVSAHALTREQAALLVASLPNPREWNPRHPTPALTARAAHILLNEPSLKTPSGF